MAQIDEELLHKAQIEKERLQVPNLHNNMWFLDSGCSNHMCGDKNMFHEIKDCNKGFIKCGNNSKMKVTRKGSLKLVFNGVSFNVQDVYLVPDLRHNLLSMGKIQEKGASLLISNGVCSIYHTKRGVIVRSKMNENRMFILMNEQQIAAPQNNDECLHTRSDLTQLWHQRYEHLGYIGLKLQQSKNMVQGLPQLEKLNFTCVDCLAGKQNRSDIPKQSQWRASGTLELIHADICGPIEPISNSEKRYLLCFIDDFSRKGWVHLLSQKSEALECFKLFKTYVEKETGECIKCLRTDRGGEFNSYEFKPFCEKEDIKRQLINAYTSHQNGVAERKNRTIMNMVRCMLIAKGYLNHFGQKM